MKKFNKYDYEFYLGKCIYRSKFGTPYVNGVGINFLKNLSYEDELRVTRALNRLADFEESKIQIDNDSSRWIPCHERMPKPHEEVLVCNDTDIFIAWWYNDYNNIKRWYSPDSKFDSLYPIIAWKPLPEPY